MLMHGCKEGQCASCKSFILDGDDVEHDRYSTFALPDYEKEEGFTLLCRAHAYEDLTIELLNYDEEMIQSGLPIKEAVVEVVSNENVTHDMRHLVVRLVEPTALKFFPGQYVDFAVPGTGGHPLVLDGEHLQPGERAVGVRHQGLSGRAVLRLPGHARSRSATGSTSPGRSASSRCASARLGPGVRRRRGGDGADPGAAALDGRARDRAQGDVLLRRPPQAGPLLRGRAARDGARACPDSVTCRPCPSPTRATTGTARSA